MLFFIEINGTLSIGGNTNNKQNKDIKRSFLINGHVYHPIIAMLYISASFKPDMTFNSMWRPFIEIDAQ